jgi:WD40 repeat protein
VNCPYKGLAPYEDDELDADLFFGREREREIVTANLVASRLTVLYGASGVGKSSLLRAGVAHGLRRTARENEERHGDPEHAVVIFGAWSDDPVPALIDEVAGSAEPRLHLNGVASNGTRSLAHVLAQVSDAVEGNVYLILDQFEEFFVYHGAMAAEQFGAELADVVRAEGLRVNVLVSLRDDALAELDRFAGKLPAILTNSVRIEHLDRAAGRAAIVQPLERYARLTGQPVVDIEEALVDAVLDEVTTGRMSIGERSIGQPDSDGRDARIEAPYLQLVMERLWLIETAAGSKTLRLSTLRDLGGAASIVAAHFEGAVDSLPPTQQELAARVFGHLVTPSGTKIAHDTTDLARYAGVENSELEPVLVTLAEARILRTVAASDGVNAAPRFEIYHDVLAEPVLGWKRRFESEQELAAARRRQRRLTIVTGIALLAVAAMVAVTVFALSQRSEAREQASIAQSRELAAAAASEATTDPELGLLLALEAARVRQTPEAENALRQALISTPADLVLPNDGEPVQVAAAKDGLVATVTTAGTLRRFDASTGQLVEQSAGDGPIVAAALDSAGTYAASADPEGIVHVVDAGSGEEVSAVDHGGPVAGLAFSDDGDTLVTAGRDGRARVWQTASGSRLAEVDHGAALTSAAVSSSKTLLATAGRDGVTRLWSLPAGELVREIEGHRGVVADVAFSRDGATLATGGTDGLARVVDVATGDLLATLIGHGNSITAVAFSPDDQWIVTGSRDRSARVWQLPTGRLAALLLGHADRVTSVGFDPTSETIVTGSADGTARIWAATPDQTLTILAHLDGPALDGSFMAGDETIAVAGPGDTTTILDATSGTTVTTLPQENPVVGVAPAGAGNVLAAVGSEALLRAVATGETLRRFDHGATVVAAAMSPDGSLVATAGEDGVARVFDADTANVELELTAGSGQLTDLDFSPDGSSLATSGTDKIARVWNLQTGEVEHELRGHTDDVSSVSFSPDGTSIVTASRDHDARVWTVLTGDLAYVLRAHFAEVRDARFSPDGRWIVTAGPGTAGLWQAGSGDFLFYLRGHEERLTSATFGPDSRRILTTSEDGTVRVYRCRICGSLEELATLARERLDRLDRRLTESERIRFLET